LAVIEHHVQRLAVSLVVALGLSGQLVPNHPFTARAVAAPPTTKASPEKVAADVRARELFEKGDAAYAEGRYEEAHAAFVEAYELSGRPQLLFNVSNALERLGRYAEAAFALERYLASGKVKDRDVVQKRLANLRKRADEQKIAEDKAREDADRRRAEAAETDASHKNQEAGATAPRQTSAEGPSRVLPVVLLGTGAAALVTAGVFGGLTLSARSDVDASCRSVASGRLCSSEASSAIDRDKTFGLVADIALVSGVVLGAAGLYLLLAGEKNGARVEARPAGAGAVVVGSF
jgi:tetratricopeptide (TPR) repeat protein